MSSTIKQAILSLKSRIADAYTAIAAKGGTMPATQDSVNLPTAIESIPGREDYDIISGIRLSDDPSDPSSPTRPLPEGMRLTQLLCDSTIANSVTILSDNNTGWTLNEQKLAKLLDLLPMLEHISLNVNWQLRLPILIGGAYYGSFTKREKLITLNIPEVTSAILNANVSSTSDFSGMTACISQNSKLEEVYAPKFDAYYSGGNGNQFNALIAGCPVLKKITLGKVANNNYHGWGYNKFVIQYCEALEELHVAGVVENNYLVRAGQNANLILLDFTAEQTNSANLRWWNPMNALDANRTDLIKEGSTAQNNLQQFLLNFRSFIALRLANRTGATSLILTLSTAVYSALTSDTSTLADLGITASDLTAVETAAGITTATVYNSWLDTYRAAINWTIAHP